MASFDRDALRETHDVPALLVPAKRTSAYVKALRRHLVDVPRYRTVASVDDSSKKKILLSRQLPRDDPCTGLPEEAASFLRKALNEGEAEPTTHQITLAYDHFTAEEVLRKLLPAAVPTPSAFEHVGHVRSRRPAVPSRHRRASSPGEEVVGGLFFDFETVRTESSDRNRPRRWPT